MSGFYKKPKCYHCGRKLDIWIYEEDVMNYLLSKKDIERLEKARLKLNYERQYNFIKDAILEKLRGVEK